MDYFLSESFKGLLVYIWPKSCLCFFERNTFVIFCEIMNELVSTQVTFKNEYFIWFNNIQVILPGGF